MKEVDARYKEAVEFLYSQTPMFQQIGAAAYKPGLDTVRRLAELFGSPEKNLKVIHVGGTNGKGSVSHTLAACLQSQGYKVGLFTSPHLVDFRERIRVDGEMISRQAVVDFVERYKVIEADVHPSFFELTTVMAFDYFSRRNVDFAVIEVGLGGRLDSTNIVDPLLDVITNVSFDHTAQLGNTLKSIAYEKSGIMRRGVPVLCGEPDAEIREYFAENAREKGTPIEFAQILPGLGRTDRLDDKLIIKDTPFGELEFELTGNCQRENALTIIAALRKLKEGGMEISDEAVKMGFQGVCRLTGLRGRWQTIGEKPLAICDTGHNIAGIRQMIPFWEKMPRPLTMVLGFVSDKDVDSVLPLFPRDATFIFTQPSVPRRMPVDFLVEKAARCGIAGLQAESVSEAYDLARRITPEQGSVFIGGSTFVVADLLADVNFSC